VGKVDEKKERERERAMKIVKAEVESIYLRVVGRRPGYLTTGGHRFDPVGGDPSAAKG
jgi:hypothetical protein